MKFALVFCAVLGLSFGSVIPHGNKNHGTQNLGDLFNELMELIPKDKIVEIVIEYLEKDPEVQEAFAYLQSDDFKKLVTTVEGMPQFKELAKYLADSGIDIYNYINKVNDLLGLPHFEPAKHRRVSHIRPRGIMDMVKDILAILPLDELKAFYHEKIENDPEFQELLARLRSPEFKELVETVKNMPEYTDLIERLKSHGIDVEKILKWINDFFGWNRFSLHSMRNLGDLFQELMELIPKDKIISIVLDYLQKDPEVQEAYAYLQSDDFKKLVTTVEGMPQFKELAKYLADSGLDIYTYINMVNDLLGLPHYEPAKHKRVSHIRPRGIMDMVKDILAILPLDELKAFYHEKIENDPEFQELLARLRSPEFKELVETVKNMPEYSDLIERLKSHGIDVEKILKWINDFFGWNRFSLHSMRSLGDLFEEFLKLIPVDKIIEIVTKYIENDPEVQEAVAYLKSDEFKSLVEKIQNMPQYYEYLEYIYNAGIDVYKYINYVHGLLGLPPVHRPGSFRHTSRSLMGMIQEILEVLPIEEMKAFYHEKVENDPEFQEFLAKLKSPEFLELVEAVRNMPEYQDMLDRLRAHGVDVDAIVKKINDFFGWN